LFQIILLTTFSISGTIQIFNIWNLANKKAWEAGHVAGSSWPLDRPGERPGSAK
jgi:hypothetical protein